MGEIRSEQITIKLTAEEHARAQAVADHLGLNIAAMFRMVIREKAREFGCDEPQATRKK